MQSVDRLGQQAVAVPNPMGDEVHDVTAEQFQRASQDDRRNHAIDVIIAMDRDSLLSLDRSEQPVDRLRHVGKLEGIVQMVEGGVEKTCGRRRGPRDLEGTANAPPRGEAAGSRRARSPARPRRSDVPKAGVA